MGHPTSMVDVVRGLVVNLVDVGVQKRCLFADNVKRTVKLAPPNKQNAQAIQREGPVDGHFLLREDHFLESIDDQCFYAKLQ